MKISIIIPAHNEEKRIEKTLEEYGKFFENLKAGKKIKDFEIIIVLNGCKDRTIDIAKKATRKYKEIKYLEFEQAGKGFAIIEGFKEALKQEFDFIGFVDADMATSPESFYMLLENIKNNDGIIASRRVKEAVVNPPKSLRRVIASSIFNFLVRSLFFMPYKDTQCGAKIFKRKVIEGVSNKIETTKWAFDVDLLYKLKKENMKIKEFPTYWSDKEYSKINLASAGPNMFFGIIRLRILHSPLKGTVKLYDKISEYLK